MANPTIKLDVNIPLVGVVKYVDKYPEKENPDRPGETLPAQWGFNGVWDERMDSEGNVVPAGPGKLYVDEYQIETDLVAAGLVSLKNDGSPRWNARGKVRFFKREGENRRRYISVRSLDGAPAPAAAPTAAPAPAPAPRAAPPAAPAAQAAPAPREAGEAVSAADREQHVTDAERATRRQWLDIQDRAELCYTIARTVLGENAEMQAVVSYASTLFISSDHQRLPAPTRRKTERPE